MSINSHLLLKCLQVTIVIGGVLVSIAVGAKPALQIAATTFELVSLAMGLVLIELSKIALLVLAVTAVQNRDWISAGILSGLFLIAILASLLSLAEFVSAPFNALVTGSEIYRLLERQDLLLGLDLDLILMLLLMTGVLSVQVSAGLFFYRLIPKGSSPVVETPKSSLMQWSDHDVGDRQKVRGELQNLLTQNGYQTDLGLMEDQAFAHRFLRVSIYGAHASQVDFSEIYSYYRVICKMLGYQPVIASVLGKQLTNLGLHLDKTQGGATGSVRYHGIAYRIMRLDEFIEVFNQKY